MKRFLICILILVCPQLSWGFLESSTVSKGNQLYNQKKYDDALEKYNNVLNKSPDSSVVNFNVGSTIYKKGEYEKAVPYFEKSLLSDDSKLQAKGHYNLGNAMYKSGIQKEHSDLNLAIKFLEGSLSHYEKSLALNPEDSDPQFNAEIVKLELERLKKKQKEQSKGNQQKQNTETTTNQGQTHPTDDKKKFEGTQDNQDTTAQQKDDNNAQDQKDHEQASSAKESLGEEEKSSGNEQSAGSGLKPDEISSQEAKILLDNYSQNEEPKGLLNLHFFQKQGGEDSPVKKDW